VLQLSLAAIVTSCDDGNHPEDYDFDQARFCGVVDVVRVTCYEVPSSPWLSEDTLKGRKFRSQTVYGDDAKTIWRKFFKNYSGSGIGSSHSKFTNQNYQLVAENAAGKKSSVMVKQTFRMTDGRYLACKAPGRFWYCALSDAELILIGVR
jgi:hypothetical protein